MGLAFKQIRSGNAVIEAQLNTGYESSSGFRDAFSKIMGAPPTKFNQHNKILKASWLDTKLGPMIAIADRAGLYLLEFVDRRGLEREVERLRQKTKSAIIPGSTRPLLSIENEFALRDSLLLRGYFQLKHLGQSDEKAFGLEKSDVIVEAVPMIVSPISHLDLVRIYKNNNV